MTKADEAQIDWSTRDMADGLDAICRHYYPLSQNLAKRFCARHTGNVDHDHIRSSAGMALLDAVRKFEPDRGWKFETYAFRKILGAMIDAMRDHDHLSKTSRQWVKQRLAAEADLLAEHCRVPSPDEVCERLGWSRDQYWYSLGGTMRSINNKKRDSGETEFADHLAAKPNTLSLDRDDNFDELMRGFSVEHRTIVYLYYFRKASMKAIADVLDVRESRVCQIHKEIVERLRQLPERFGKGA
jgi:RNA polymerase sigma factor FliA